ncbi:MAG TPA: tryptophan synthase subunit alpha [Acidimicrobiales bacterium]|nr:tryptophan synthase subunit alpha [Acidimicrobiales bacterium]
MQLESRLRELRAGGRKLLVPYVTGGMRGDWVDVARAMVDGGADALEVGIPFSDPVMDGPTIQEASSASLARGTTPQSILADLRGADLGVPLVAMTYYNLVFRAGHKRFADGLADAGVGAAIVPDLCLEESREWESDAAAAGIETVLLAAPVTPRDRLEEICARAHGFVYGVGLMGVTGERTTIAASTSELAIRLKAATDRPVLMGFGISTPSQAAQVSADADGVIVASALMRAVLDGASAESVGDLVRDLRRGLDYPAND